MNAMIAVSAIIVLFSVFFLLLLIVAVASRRFRGAAIGLMLMSLVGGTAFLLFTYLMASRQMEVSRQRVAVERASMADQYREGIILDDEPSVIVVPKSVVPESAEASSGDAEIVETDDMTVVETVDVDATELSQESSDGQSVTEAAATDTASPAVTADSPVDPAEPSANSGVDDSSRTVEADAGSSSNGPIDPGVTKPFEVTHYQVERPSWVDDPPQMVDGHPAEVIVSDAYVTGDECEENLNERIAAAIQHHAAKRSRDAGGPASVAIRVGREDIRRVSRDRHLEVIDTIVGPMKQIHQLVVFDNEFERRAKEQVTQAVVGTRLAVTGALAGGALILLATSFGLLRIISRSS